MAWLTRGTAVISIGIAYHPRYNITISLLPYTALRHEHPYIPQYHPQGTPRKRKIKASNMVRLPRDAIDALCKQYRASESTPSKLIR